MDLRVFRRIIDEIPLEVVTRVQVDVAGRPREVLLGRALLGGFDPYRLESPLPARVEPGGRLRLQVRPGRWTVELSAQRPADTTELPLEPGPQPWPAEEIWIFDARNDLRLVEPLGVPSIDPRQTNLPPAWQGLPAFRVRPGEKLTLKVIRRGDPEPAPDRIALNRILWLDFGGSGYTVRDSLTGTVTRSWRLEAGPGLRLGRAAVDGRDQFVTLRPGAPGPGVELRRGRLQMVADSRIAGDVGRLPAIGWDHDMEQVRATLRLPPGWDLLAVGGVDNLPLTWLQRWTLLDLFLVFLGALAAARLKGWKTGLLALACLGLAWHAPGAPRFVWLNILAALALLRVVPEGRARRWVAGYRNLSFVALAVIFVPFAAAQIRTALFPQLERPWQSAGVLGEEPAEAMRPAPEQVPSSGMLKKPSAVLGGAKSEPAYEPYQRLEQVDPRAKIQTGPGVPTWSWREIPLLWNGPVGRDQSVRLVYLSPAANLALKLGQVLLTAWLGAVLLGLSSWKRRSWRRASAAALLLWAPAAEAWDGFPPPALLQDLRARLEEPAECLPSCAQVPRLWLEAKPNALRLRVEVHALAQVAVPLPGSAAQWLPAVVSSDGGPAQAVSRATDGSAWVVVPEGIHQLVLEGPLPSRSSVTLPLPLPPRHVEIAAEGWAVAGVHEDGSAEGQIQLTRTGGEPAQPGREALEPGALPPLLRVERTLLLGLDWRAATRVIRLSPGGGAVVIEVPLLEGESVTTEGVRVSNRRALLSLGSSQSEAGWESVVETRHTVALEAPAAVGWTEAWRLDASPIWHVEQSGGIPAVHHKDPEGRWLPEWRPWPGERVELSVSRPAGVEGQTLTIDGTRLEVNPGRRATAATLTVRFRSSQGGQHTVMLPETAELQSVVIDGAAQPVRQENRRVSLPITPGAHQAALSFRTASPIRPLLRTPALDLGAASVNQAIRTVLGADRWVLLTGGPSLGPAVLFWGVVLALVPVAWGLGGLRSTPLRARHWFLLGLGLTQTSATVALLIVAWFAALGVRRERIGPAWSGRWFNWIQVGLVVLTAVAFGELVEAVRHGLLGLPEMQVAGNGSTAYDLRWYQDRSGALLSQAWVLTAPLLVYRLLMLAWALWLAFSLLGWARWGWRCFSEGGLWRPVKVHRPRFFGRRGPPDEEPEPDRPTEGGDGCPSK
jgi:hypothetical protein